MREMAISKFKATCLSVLDEVSKTNEPVKITKRGKAIAQVVPAPPPDARANWFGSLAGTAKIVGDIVSPAFDEKDFDALR